MTDQFKAWDKEDDGHKYRSLRVRKNSDGSFEFKYETLAEDAWIDLSRADVLCLIDWLREHL